MKLLRILLRATVPVLVAVGGVHLLLGVGAEVLLGAQLSEPVLRDPVLDSQNRFYGVAFTLYAAVFWLGSGDPARYAPALKAAFAIFFAGGLARVVAWSQHGAPGPMVTVLLVLELLLPPVFLLALRRAVPPDSPAPR